MVTPLGTFETKTREGTPHNLHFAQESQGSLIGDSLSTSEELTKTQSEETTSSQMNQEFEEFLQQERYNEQRFKSREHFYSKTTNFGTTSLGGNLGGFGRGRSNMAMLGGVPPMPRKGMILFLHTREE